jgi:2'-5' RNA ligase
MKLNLQTIPGYRVNEYLVVLNPHMELRSKIMQVKKEFYDTYKTSSALGGKPQILLARFSQYEMLEERIVSRLKMVGMGYQPFKVELRDFGSFPSHTIFINVTTKVPVQNLVRQIRESQRLMKIDNDHKPYFNDDPYITVARKLLPWQYEQGWLDYSHRHFTGRFIADSMLLLKRRVGDKAYQIAERFEFMNLPVATRQGELFV